MICLFTSYSVIKVQALFPAGCPAPPFGADPSLSAIPDFPGTPLNDPSAAPSQFVRSDKKARRIAGQKYRLDKPYVFRKWFPIFSANFSFLFLLVYSTIYLFHLQIYFPRYNHSISYVLNNLHIHLNLLLILTNLIFSINLRIVNL